MPEPPMPTKCNSARLTKHRHLPPPLRRRSDASATSAIVAAASGSARPRPPAHLAPCRSVRRQARQRAGEPVARSARHPAPPSRTGDRRTAAGVVPLVVVGGKRVGDQDRRAPGRSKFGQTSSLPARQTTRSAAARRAGMSSRKAKDLVVDPPGSARRPRAVRFVVGAGLVHDPGSGVDQPPVSARARRSWRG